MQTLVRALQTFFRSPYYIAVVMALMAVGELFSLEMPVFYAYLAFGAVGLLFCNDAIALTPIVLASYTTFSAPNNPSLFPAGSENPSYFTRPEAIVQLIVILAVSAILMVGRLAISLAVRREKGAPVLWLGFAVLGLVFVLGGAFSKYYAFDTVFLGVAQLASLALFYFYFYYTVDWKETGKSYVFLLLALYGVGLAAEAGGMYFLPGAFENGAFHRDAFYTGWGVYNNVGCMIGMCMPACFYLAAVKKRGWLFTLLGCFTYCAVVFSQSRSAILCGAAVLAGCLVALFVYSAHRARKEGKRELVGHIITVCAVLVAVGALCGILYARIETLFRSMFKAGLNDSGRFKLFKGAWADFLEAPFFGKGFYHTWGSLLMEGGAHACPETPAGIFLPGRVHNTELQMLASCGAIGLIGYLYHRAETFALFFRRPSAEKTFAFLSVCVLLLTSLLDCHFFNFGPGLCYGILLVFTEKTADPAPARRKRSA